MTDKKFNEMIEENGIADRVREINAKIHKTDYIILEHKINNLLDEINKLNSKLEVTCSRITRLEISYKYDRDLSILFEKIKKDARGKIDALGKIAEASTKIASLRKSKTAKAANAKPAKG